METNVLDQSFSDMRAMAEQQSQGRYAGDEKLMVQFHTMPVMNVAKSEAENRPIYDEVEHVRILIPGSKDAVVDKPVTSIEKARFRKLYTQWKEKEAVDFSGTPLESCTWISRSQVEEMKYFNVRTLEQLAGMADVHAQKFAGIGMLRDRAKVFLAQAEKGKAASDLAEAVKAQKQENEDLREQLKGLQETMARMPQVPAPPKPKRGRTAAA